VTLELCPPTVPAHRETVRIAPSIHRTRWGARMLMNSREVILWCSSKIRMVLNELEELLAEAFADLEFWAREHLPVFRETRAGNVQPGRFSDR
jgi:hypothetical protein